MFLRQVFQCFPSLRLVNCLESRLTLHLKDSTGINWSEELPYDPANVGEGLEVMSPVDYSIHVLVGSRMKTSLSPSVMLLHDRSLGSEGKSHLDSR